MQFRTTTITPAATSRMINLSRGGRRRAPGFSLAEVVLALGVMGLAVVSILGLIGPTLGDVKTAEDLNVATGCIEKMNTIIEMAPFWDNDAILKTETVYDWVYQSASDSPTIFLFYNEIPVSSGGNNQDLTPVQRVVRFNKNHAELNQPLPSLAVVQNYRNDPTLPQLPMYRTMNDFVTAVAQNRISGPVIAMTLSPSPLMLHFPNTTQNGAVDETQYYSPPPQSGSLAALFPSKGSMTSDPSGINDKIYPEGYFPIYVQAFAVSTTSVLSSQDTSAFEQQLLSSLTMSTRLFTYTTAKLR
jgi:hypothetical protein